MKISEQVNTVERIGVQGEQRFGLEFNAKMAKILSKNIYSNPIRAVIRELSCNAADSHIAAGRRDVPFEVHLPSVLEPWFSVQDRGLGLSHDEVMKLFATYGASSKSNSNDFTGALGLGSKSPFAYRSNFDVTSVSDGVQRSYSMFKNELGEPVVAPMGSQITSECNGVCVRIAVDTKDHDTFRREAENVFAWFAQPPVVTGNTNYNHLVYNKILEGKGWYMAELPMSSPYGYSRGIRGMHALMGNVLYPISRDQLPERLRRFADISLVVHFEIGELDVSASREELNYDDTTVAVVAARVELVQRDLLTVAQHKLDSCNTLWDARLMLRTMRRDDQMRHVIGFLIQEGTKVPWKGTLAELSDYVMCMDMPSYKQIALSKSVGGKHSRFNTSTTVDVRPNIRIYVQDVSNARSRIKHYLNQQRYDEPVYVVSGEPKDIKAFIQDLGYPPTVAASTLPPPPRNGMEFKGRVYTGGPHWRYRARKIDNWGEESKLNSADQGFYITVDGGEPVDDQGKIIHGFKEFIQLARDLNIVPSDTQVWGINKTNTKMLKKIGNTSWKDFDAYFKLKVQDLLKKAQTQQVLNTQKSLRGLRARFTECSRTEPEILSMPPLNNCLGQFVEAWRRTIDNHKQAVAQKIPQLIRCAELLGLPMNHDTTSPTLIQMWDTTLVAYPLLKTLEGMRHPNIKHYVEYVKAIDAMA